MPKKIFTGTYTRFCLSAILGTAFIILVYSIPVRAGDGTFNNPVGSDDFEILLNGIANFIIRLGIPLLTVFIVYTGFQIVTAQGNEEQLSTAKKRLYYTVIGTAIIMGAVKLAQLLVQFGRSIS